MNKVELFQIYYDVQQKGRLLDGFTPHFNERATTELESRIICEIIPGAATNSEWVGVFPWKIRSKLKRISRPRIVNHIDENYDIITPQPNQYPKRVKGPHFPRRQPSMEGVWPCIDMIVDKLKLSTEPVLVAKLPRIYYNAFVAKSDVYINFVDSILKPAIDLSHEDEELNNLMMAPSEYPFDPPVRFTEHTGHKKYPWAPFVLERLINVFIELNNIKTKRTL